ncbi:MAG: PA14 domain-containing protein [Luteolibacter sp.]|uniref:PA14 domain-containing protein n=2 Tax=Luteolibacter sp. TaxID=1962973 RepID=UPI00326671D2
MNRGLLIISRVFLPMMIGSSLAAAAPVMLQAKSANGQTLEQVPVQANGRSTRAWSCDEQSGELTFRAVTQVAIPADGVLYLKVAYLDEGYGRLNVQLIPDGEKPIKPDRFLGCQRTNSGKVVSALMRMNGIRVSENGGISVRVGIERSAGVKLAIGGVRVQDTAFEEPNFQYVISDPWNGPYRGARVKPADNSTLKGKVMTGYQGWFRTPNDPDGRGWVHWGNIQEGEFTTDMWPDVSQYSSSSLEKAADVKLKSGAQAYLFSSAWPGVVDTHFRWMREHDIDGAFLQRFVSDDFNSINGRPEWVLANVRAAANREGRIWAVEYDVSGYPDAKLLETLKTDWKWFVDRFHVLDDPNYAREGGKPVVFIWGLPFPNRNISPETANAVVDFFKNDPKYGGNHLIGGIPGNWREMAAPWQDHFKKYDGVLSWMSQSYAKDMADFGKLGLSYHAHVMPGFSWANLKHLPSGDPTLAYTPRDGGQHYWNQLSNAAKAGSDRMFVGMFDEYDEGTAIIPMSDDSPPTPKRAGVAATFYNGPNAQEQGRFVRLPRAELELGTTAPHKGISAENFFVRMGGRITFPVAGQYTFSIEGAPGDDVELFFNGEKVLVANHLNGAATTPKAIAVSEGASVDYRLDYRHRTGKGSLRLLWECQDRPRQPVPPEALQDAWGRFITNEGKPSDWWLTLTRMGKEMMNRKRKVDSPMP